MRVDGASPLLMVLAATNRLIRHSGVCNILVTPDFDDGWEDMIYRTVFYAAIAVVLFFVMVSVLGNLVEDQKPELFSWASSG